MYQKIENDIKEAMKAASKERLSVLRMLKSAFQAEKTNQREDLPDDKCISVLRKQVKIRKESMKEYEEYNRPDLVTSLSREIEILSEYLPEELSDAQIEAKLDEIFAELKPESIKDMGRLMKEAATIFGSSVDMSIISSKIKERLN